MPLLVFVKLQSGVSSSVVKVFRQPTEMAFVIRVFNTYFSTVGRSLVVHLGWAFRVLV